MAGRLLGKRVLITAAAQGIGRATALAMAREGQVLATDVNATLLLDLEAEEGLTTASLDVTNASQIARLAEAQGALDVLVNVTGVRPPRVDSGVRGEGLIFHEPERQIDVPHDPGLSAGHAGARWRQHHQHCLGRLEHQRAAQPLHLRHQQGGGDRADQVGRRRLRAPEVRCNAIAPGTIQSPSLDERIQAFAGKQRGASSSRGSPWAGSARRRRSRRSPSIWPATSAYTTGQVFVVDGGITI